MEPKKRQRRSRAGCWTCRNRRKKCDSVSFPCGNCRRLGLDCNTETKLVWEDDSRRQGMKRRGPSKSTNPTNATQPVDGQTGSQERDHNPVTQFDYFPASLAIKGGHNDSAKSQNGPLN
ncbi:hypothetical protein NCS52_01214900 [Fusarium sp. LHS14.1]|nr:hypothetical protein NCS52_01214900 [Fusarium sp. LHS14.1]